MSRALTYLKKMLTPYTQNPENKKYEGKSKPSRPIYIFYHIYCGKNDYMGIVSEQLSAIKDSGLLDAAQRMYVSIAGADADRDRVKAVLPEDKAEIIYESSDGGCYEFPAYDKMKSLSRGKSFYAMYIHAKGTSLSEKSAQGEKVTFKQIDTNVRRWRRLMEYFLIDRWQMAVNVLNSGYTTYGSLLKHIQPCWHDRAHYSGNFWWATSEAIAAAAELTGEYRKNRWNAEFWIVKDVARAYSCFDNPYLLYQTSIPERVYKSSGFSPSHALYALKHYFLLPKMIKRKRYLF